MKKATPKKKKKKKGASALSSARIARPRHARALAAKATTTEAAKAVLDTAFALSVALDEQSRASARWTSSEIQLWVDERRETTALIERMDAPASRLRAAPEAELIAARQACESATQSVRAAASSAGMLTAINATNAAQRLLLALC
jgi:hypothetical protein